jgi:hypothetical protein
MRFLIISLLSTFFFACSSAENTSDQANSDQPNLEKALEEDAHPLKKEKIQDEEEPEEEKVSLKVQYPEMYLLFNEYKEKPYDIPESFEKLLIEIFDFPEDMYLGYDLNPIDENQDMVLLRYGLGCSASTCVKGYAVILLDRNYGMLDYKEFSVSSAGEPTNARGTTIVAKNILVHDSKEPIFESNPEFIRDIEHVGDEDKREIFAVLDNKVIDLAKAGKSELRKARNLIYARKGYQFKSKDLQNYFAQYDWYEPKHKESSGLLDDFEKSVAETILEWEKTS